MKSKIFITSFFLICFSYTFAQVQRDHDLITMKDNTQYLGFIIEQKPGKHVKIFRPSINDTVTVNLKDVDHVSKILVQNFSEKKIESRDSVIETGRYNNKRNVFQASYLLNISEYYGDFIQGFSLGYYKSFNNRYLLGLSGNFFINQKTERLINEPGYDQAISVSNTINQFHLMFESKYRLGRKLQNKRLSTLLGLNIGYVFDNTERKFPKNQPFKPNLVQKEELKGSFILQASLSFKVNPDNNSGFIIEPGYAFYAPQIKQYSLAQSDGTQSLQGNYLGYKKEDLHLFTFRLSYFF